MVSATQEINTRLEKSKSIINAEMRSTLISSLLEVEKFICILEYESETIRLFIWTCGTGCTKNLKMWNRFLLIVKNLLRKVGTVSMKSRTSFPAHKRHQGWLKYFSLHLGIMICLWPSKQTRCYLIECHRSLANFLTLSLSLNSVGRIYCTISDNILGNW